MMFGQIGNYSPSDAKLISLCAADSAEVLENAVLELPTFKLQGIYLVL